MAFATGAAMVLAVLIGVTLQLMSNARLADRVSLLESLVAAQQRQPGAPGTVPDPKPSFAPATAPGPEAPDAEEPARTPAEAIPAEEKPVVLPPVEATLPQEFSVSQRESLRRKVLPELSEQYGSFVAKLGLGVGEEIAFYDALVDERVAVLAGRSAQPKIEERLRAALGDAGFANYLSHREGLGVRALIAAFKKKVAGTGTPIDGGQAETLFKLISEERERHAALDAKNPDMPKSIDALRGQPPEVMGKFVSSQMALVEGIEARAGEVLTPKQAAVLGEIARDQVEALKQKLAAGH